MSVSTAKLFDLQGRRFLVVGGAHGLGHDVATAMAEAGADGIITSRNAAAAAAAARGIAEQAGRYIEGAALDACDEHQIADTVRRALQRFETIDVLVNCVGGGGGGVAGVTDLERRELEQWERVHRTNLTAPFLVCKHVVPAMRTQKRGSIINIASIAGMIGRDRSVYPAGMPPQPLDYASAKAAIIGFTRDLAAYVGNDKIRANCISPGGFERGQPQEFIEAYRQKCVLGRMGRDGVDLKGPAVFLASDASAYVTGHNLVVDGGFTIWQ